MTKTIAVIDGNSLMHRAYHAIQTPMNSLDGTPTNAVFGFLQMFCKFIEVAHPDAVICAFDAGKPEYRIADMPEYKANRPHMDDELRVQFPVIEELLSSMNVPVVKVPGWEGDDILGTIAARDEKLGFKTYLVTGDKDACQLASDLTSIVNTKKGISDVVVLDPGGVFEKYGVTPEQFPDFLGLMGDSSDNIPGVPGIGQKTAQAILEQYGNIEGIYEHIDDFKGKRRENLENNEDLAYLSRQIATIVRDLDFELDIEGASFPAFEIKSVENAFRKYSLSSPLTRVLALIDAKPLVEKVEITIGDILLGNEAVSALDNACKGSSAIGIAWRVGEQDTIFGREFACAFAFDGACAFLRNDEAIAGLSKCLKSGKACTLDLKETLQFIYPPDGCEATMIVRDRLYEISAFDAGLAAYLLDSASSTYSYNDISERFLGGKLPEYESDEEALCAKAACMRDAKPALVSALKEDGSYRVFSEIDLPLVAVLVDMERVGVRLDAEELQVLGEESSAEIETLAKRIYEIAGEEFNIGSPKQVGHILFEVLELPVIKKNKGGGYSTDATVLRELAKTEEVAKLIIEYREYSKIKGTYIDSLPKMKGCDGRLHTSFHQTVTATGRLSSSDPNLQNIPVRTEFGRRIRDCFIPLEDDSVFMSADYSQIELRLLAHLSGDVGLIKAFTEGTDFHTMTAARVFNVDPEDVTPQQRSRAKAVNFGIVYGQQAFGLAQSLDIARSEAKEIIDAYYLAYPRVREYLDKVVADARIAGYAETLYGRKRHIPELRSSNKQLQAQGERNAMNHPMQGTAADIIKIAMIEVEKRLRDGGYKSQLMLQVHDELDLSVPKNEIDGVSAMLKDVMENVIDLSVPLSVDVSWAEDWAKAH